MAEATDDIALFLAHRAADEPPKVQLSIGTMVGEWRVEAYLGTGLSAEVYRVTNVRFGQNGALKLLTNADPELHRRFLMESDAIRFLSLRALPRFMGSGSHNGMPYYVMEHLQSIEHAVAVKEIPNLMVKVAKAVQMLHDSGYLHRDIKLANILCRESGEPVLIDLGLVKKLGPSEMSPLLEEGEAISTINGNPVGVGTRGFAAPEQLNNGISSVRADVYALGKVFVALYDEDPIPYSIRRIIKKATQFEAANRYASANQMAAAIRRRHRPFKCLAGLGILLVAGLLLYPLYPKAKTEFARWQTRLALERQATSLTGQRAGEEDVKYFSRMLSLAQKHNAMAQIAVAEAYFYGRGTEVNQKIAFRWYEEAAKAGEAGAQDSLGLCYAHGYGCQKNYTNAVFWWEMAAKQNHLSGMSNLAYAYLHGFGVQKDAAKGFELAKAAAERGHMVAQRMVGECYSLGMGVKRNYEEAEVWLSRAARQGDMRAKELLSLLP